MALHVETLTPRVSGILEHRAGIATHAPQGERDIAARVLEQKDIGLRSDGAVDHCRQGINLHMHCVESVLRRGLGLGKDDPDRLADVANLVVSNDRLLEWLEFGGRFLPQRNYWNAASDIDIRGGDHRMHAGARQSGLFLNSADAAMRDRTAHDDGVEHVLQHEIVHILAPPGQKAEILETLYRASDQRVPCASGSHMTMAACSLRMARATLSAAKAEVFGLVREGLPSSSIAKRPAAPSTTISCTLPGAAGSATSSTSVRSKPRPAIAI